MLVIGVLEPLSIQNPRKHQSSRSAACAGIRLVWIKIRRPPRDLGDAADDLPTQSQIQSQFLGYMPVVGKIKRWRSRPEAGICQSDSAVGAIDGTKQKTSERMAGIAIEAGRLRLQRIEVELAGAGFAADVVIVITDFGSNAEAVLAMHDGKIVLPNRAAIEAEPGAVRT